MSGVDGLTRLKFLSPDHDDLHEFHIIAPIPRRFSFVNEQRTCASIRSCKVAILKFLSPDHDDLHEFHIIDPIR